MEMISLGLCLCKDLTFLIYVKIMDAACPILQFHVEWLSIFMAVIISCY